MINSTIDTYQNGDFTPLEILNFTVHFEEVEPFKTTSHD